MEQKDTAFSKILYFGLVLWDSADEKLQGLYNFIKTLNPDLKCTMEIENQ